MDDNADGKVATPMGALHQSAAIIRKHCSDKGHYLVCLRIFMRPHSLASEAVMEIEIGRLIDHVHLRTRDLVAAKRFYRAVLGVLGVPIRHDDERHLNCDELYIDALGEDLPSASHIHLAFQAKDRATVDIFHKAGLAAGGKDNGAPGERNYHPGYYGAFLIDPDGNNIEAVYHGPSRRTAPSVKVSF